MRRLLLLCLFLSPALLLAADKKIDPHAQGESRTYKSAKDEKVAKLTLEIAKAEIQDAELGVELQKLEKLNEGTRSKRSIELDREFNAKILERKRAELEITKELYSSECRAKLVIEERNVPVYDRDSGIRTDSKEQNFLVCVAIADTCTKFESPQALITSVGSDIKEEWISGKKDPREGKPCQCLCIRR